MDLQTATASTLHILKARRLLLRLFTLAQGASVLCAILFPLLLRPIWAVASFACAPVFWALYIGADTLLVQRWRGGLLRAWLAKEINLGVLASALSTLPSLPKATIAAMLTSLPDISPAADRDLSDGQRQAFARAAGRQWLRSSAPALVCAALLAAAAIALVAVLA